MITIRSSSGFAAFTRCEIFSVRQTSMQRWFTLRASSKESTMRMVGESFTMSERVAIQSAVESKIDERRGRPPKNTADRQQLSLSKQPKQGEKTLEFAARKAGFSSGTSARRAKAVVDSKNFELIDAMDKGEIALTPAEEITKQPTEEQSELLQQHFQSTKTRSDNYGQIRNALIIDHNRSDRSLAEEHKVHHTRVAKIRDPYAFGVFGAIPPSPNGLPFFCCHSRRELREVPRAQNRGLPKAALRRSRSE